MNTIPFFQVDAFTDRPFKGNPAAICLLEKELPDHVMQEIAMENNLAETAFVLKTPYGFSLRWFTPTTEIKLCGHATVASAHILWEKGILPPGETAQFYTQSGLLSVIKKEAWIQLDFPAFTHSSVPVPEEIINALQVVPEQAVYASDGRYIIELASENSVVALNPDFTVLKNFDVVVVTSKATGTSPYDFVSRTFAPSHGVNEDSVTGSSHCSLAPYWAKKLQKTRLFAYQASARGGELKLEVTDDRVLIEGKAVTIIEGSLKIDL